MTNAAKLLRVSASAELADDGRGLEPIRAHAADDDDLSRLIDEHARGDVLLVDIEVTVDVRAADGSVRRAACRNTGMIVELGDIPIVERQVSELSAKDHCVLADQLGRDGIVLDADVLEHAFTHVSLGERLRAALGHDGGIARA